MSRPLSYNGSIKEAAEFSLTAVLLPRLQKFENSRHKRQISVVNMQIFRGKIDFLHAAVEKHELILLFSHTRITFYF